MERIIDVAAYICDEYQKQQDALIGETKLHKLLYLSQREMLAIINKPLFVEPLEGWRHGPASTRVRSLFRDGKIDAETKNISNEAKYVINNVISSYGGYSANQLSNLTHSEISWQNTRRGLSQDADGHMALSLDDIREDAKKVRPYDHIFDMYYDEFDDAEDEKQ